MVVVELITPPVASVVVVLTDGRLNELVVVASVLAPKEETRLLNAVED